MMRVIIYPVLAVLIALACNLSGGENSSDVQQHFTIKVLDNPVQDIMLKMGEIRQDNSGDLAIDLEVVEFYCLPVEFQADMPRIARVRVNGLECHLSAHNQRARIYYFFTEGRWKEARARLAEASLQKGSLINLEIIKILGEGDLLPDEEIISPGNVAKYKRGNTIPFFCFGFCQRCHLFLMFKELE